MTDQREPIYYFMVQEKTAFIPFKYVYPECFYHIEDKPDLYPMKCFLEDACPVGANCGELLARRVHYLFENVVPSTECIIAYYRYRDRPKSIRGVIFDRDFDTPRVSILNPYAFKKFQQEGTTYKWYPRDDYMFMCGSKQFISSQNLIHVPEKKLWTPNQ